MNRLFGVDEVQAAAGEGEFCFGEHTTAQHRPHTHRRNIEIGNKGATAGFSVENFVGSNGKTIGLSFWLESSSARASAPLK